MSGPLTFRNSAGVLGTGKRLVSANHTFKATTGPILGVEGQICLFCNFAWTFFGEESLLALAVEMEELTFFISYEPKSHNTNDATLYNNGCRHMSWTVIPNRI